MFSGYETELLTSLPQVQYIDGVDRLGHSAKDTESLSNIPGNCTTITVFIFISVLAPVSTHLF